MTKQGKNTQVEQETNEKVEVLLQHAKKCVELFSALTNVGGQDGLDALTNLANSIKEFEPEVKQTEE